MHKDLSDDDRHWIEADAREVVRGVSGYNQSLALAREVWINAFDKAAERYDSTVAKEAEVG